MYKFQMGIIYQTILAEWKRKSGGDNKMRMTLERQKKMLKSLS